ncbi:hypothetical protein [Streptomyces gardneri]|uniref:hypothetical protein n=1 Tax=Streptomyces gardneri TaxID=66892 RepID=UPI0035D68A79
MTGAARTELRTLGPGALIVRPSAGHAGRTTAIHCEAWAGTALAPYTWLLSRDTAPSPWGAVRRLTAAAEHLADRIDDSPDDVRPFPASTLRRWIEDRLGHEDIAERLTRRAYVPEAVRISGPGHVLASAVLERMFVGGMLGFRPGTTDLEGIIERPPGGCPPGRLVNIWVHHLAGHALIRRIRRDTIAFGDYETAVNQALATNTPGTAVVLPYWEAIKDPDSLVRARALLGDTTTAA